MGRIRGVALSGGYSGVEKPDNEKKSVVIKPDSPAKKTMPLKPLPPKVSDKVKSGAGRKDRKPTKKDIRQQARRLMEKVRKRRQAAPSRQKIKTSSGNKPAHKKVVSSQLRHSHQGFVPHKTHWFKSDSDPYSTSKIVYSEDQYLVGTSPDEAFDPEYVKGDAGIFWGTSFEEGCDVIVDLTSSEEDELNYYPRQDERYNLSSGGCLIFVSEKKQTGYKKITLQYQEAGSAPRLITLFHYYAWPEDGVLRGRSRKAFHKFVQRTLAVTDKPLTVICRSGKGKAGTYIVMQQLLNQINDEETLESNLIETLERLVAVGREASDESFVETEGQFVMLIEAGYAMLELLALKKNAQQNQDDMKFLDGYI